MSEPPSNSTNPTAQPIARTKALVRLERVTKRFPGIVANDRIDLTIQAGEFHAVIGENGAGKSTLLNILYGRYRPDEGQLIFEGDDAPCLFAGPADAIRRGIGLVSQHYASIPALTVLENVILGQEPTTAGGLLNVRAARRRIGELASRLGLSGLDLDMRADRLSVAAGQKVEVLKALYRGARLLMLDEPTATLAPSEADALFVLLHELTEAGTTLLFVTHKLREVIAHSDRVTVLRRGRNAGDFLTSRTTEAELLERMVGRSSPSPMASTILTAQAEGKGDLSVDLLSDSLGEEKRSNGSVLRVERVSTRASGGARPLVDVSLEVAGGEVVGVAGVDGSGQRELAEVIVGLRGPDTGAILLDNMSIARKDVRERMGLGVGFIPEDHQRAGLVMDFTIAEDLLLGHERERKCGGGLFLRRRAMQARADTAIKTYDIRGGLLGARQSVQTLSGGNQQKIVVARAIESAPRLLVASQPTRGLDVEASEFVYRSLREVQERGAAILLFSLDLDELLAMSDRVAVLFDGRIVGILPRGQATRDTVGALMTGSVSGSAP